MNTSLTSGTSWIGHSYDAYDYWHQSQTTGFLQTGNTVPTTITIGGTAPTLSPPGANWIVIGPVLPKPRRRRRKKIKPSVVHGGRRAIRLRD